MKKILLLAMAAVMFMACENAGGGGSSSGGGMSSKDKTAVNATTVNAIKLIGQSSAKAEKAFLDAGFVKMDDGSGLLDIKARAPKHAPAIKQDGTVTVTYLYGASQDASNEELIQALKDGKCLIMMEASFSGDIFVGASTMFIAGKTAGVNKKFTYTSNELYDALPGGDMSNWTGQTAPDAATIDEGGTTYTSHASFSMDINKAEEIAAVEAASAITDYNSANPMDYKGFGYYLAWVNPTEEDFYKSSLKSIGTPVAVGEYFVADINAMSDMMK